MAVIVKIQVVAVLSRVSKDLIMVMKITVSRVIPPDAIFPSTPLSRRVNLTDPLPQVTVPNGLEVLVKVLIGRIWHSEGSRLHVHALVGYLKPTVGGLPGTRRGGGSSRVAVIAIGVVTPDTQVWHGVSIVDVGHVHGVLDADGPSGRLVGRVVGVVRSDIVRLASRDVIVVVTATGHDLQKTTDVFLTQYK